MYKIWINKSRLILCKEAELPKLRTKHTIDLESRYIGKVKTLFSFIDLLEKSNRNKCVVIYSKHFKSLKSDFKGLYKTVKAAGGLVIDQSGNGLFIFKRGYWDLPKGKIDEGETQEVAAIREVEEETGVRNLKLIKRLCKTRHTYKTPSGKRAIKLTYWFLMSTQHQDLIPQVEEDIEKVEWIQPKSLLLGEYPFYHNLKKVVSNYLKNLPN